MARDKGRKAEGAAAAPASAVENLVEDSAARLEAVQKTARGHAELAVVAVARVVALIVASGERHVVALDGRKHRYLAEAVEAEGKVSLAGAAAALVGGRVSENDVLQGLHMIDSVEPARREALGLGYLPAKWRTKLASPVAVAAAYRARIRSIWTDSATDRPEKTKRAQAFKRDIGVGSASTFGFFGTPDSIKRGGGAARSHTTALDAYAAGLK